MCANLSTPLLSVLDPRLFFPMGIMWMMVVVLVMMMGVSQGGNGSLIHDLVLPQF